MLAYILPNIFWKELTIFYDENDFWLPYDYKITEDLLRSFLNDKPDIHKIMFFAPLVF